MRRTAVLVLVTAMVGMWSGDAAARTRLVYNLVGTGAMYPSSVPDIDGDGIDDPAMCFDVELRDVVTARSLGTATDCLSNVTPSGAGLVLVGTTFFNLPGGTLVTRGTTSVQPADATTPPTNGVTDFTHVTGAADDLVNAVVWGSGRYQHARGTSRLSGMVDLSGFGGAPGDPITFDCLFVIALVTGQP